MSADVVGARKARPSAVTWRGLLALVLVGLMASAALALDVIAVPDAQPVAAPVARPAADRGAWYCPVTAGEDEDVVLSLAAVTHEASRVTVVRHPGTEPVAEQPVELVPGRQTTVPLSGADARGPVTVRWEGGPAVVSWRTAGEQSVAGPCEPAPAPTWYVPGFDTTLGSQSTLHLYNPFTVDAVARLTYATPEGRIELLSTENVPVAAGESVRVDLNEYQPEQPDMGVVVDVLAGRLVAQGEVTIAPPGEDADGVKGRTLLPAATDPSRTMSFGYGAIGSNTRSWLALFNPNDVDTAVVVQVSDPVAEASAYGEVPVPAGTAIRIDLSEHSTENHFGVMVEAVGDVPVVASRITSIESAQEASVAASLGTPDVAGMRAVVGGGTSDRAGTLALYNSGTEPAEVSVAAGDASLTGGAGLSLGPNGFATLDLADAGTDRSGIPLVVSADQPVAVTLRSSQLNDAVAGFWTLSGVPSSAWAGPSTRLPVRRDPDLLTTPAEVLGREDGASEPESESEPTSPAISAAP